MLNEPILELKGDYFTPFLLMTYKKNKKKPMNLA